MADLSLLAARLGAADLLGKPIGAFTKEEIGLLCRSVLEAHIDPLPAALRKQSFFCPYGERVGKDSVYCRADLHASGLFPVPSALYGVPLGYCLHYCNITAEA